MSFHSIMCFEVEFMEPAVFSSLIDAAKSIKMARSKKRFLRWMDDGLAVMGNGNRRCFKNCFL